MDNMITMMLYHAIMLCHIIPGINILNNFIIYYPNSIVLYLLFIEIYFVHTIIEELYIESHFIQKLKFLRKS